ncbi:hypothetical protein MSAN_02078500 [Mycena sanguinolenta]|uniref:Uncharacterized protein n=1 Tax=Mycena sanguinolenta TaxID=230812 RepID=A0A8H6XGB0_9AGAR|nr:hypothetical protein MSAN_02078500 [Mycena sanguinolenta]
MHHRSRVQHTLQPRSSFVSCLVPPRTHTRAALNQRADCPQLAARNQHPPMRNFGARAAREKAKVNPAPSTHFEFDAYGSRFTPAPTSVSHRDKRTIVSVQPAAAPTPDPDSPRSRRRRLARGVRADELPIQTIRARSPARVFPRRESRRSPMRATRSRGRAEIDVPRRAEIVRRTRRVHTCRVLASVRIRAASSLAVRRGVGRAEEWGALRSGVPSRMW